MSKINTNLNPNPDSKKYITRLHTIDSVGKNLWIPSNFAGQGLGALNAYTHASGTTTAE